MTKAAAEHPRNYARLGVRPRRGLGIAPDPAALTYLVSQANVPGNDPLRTAESPS